MTNCSARGLVPVWLRDLLSSLTSTIYVTLYYSTVLAYIYLSPIQYVLFRITTILERIL
jgi:hypothetical protein